MPELPEVETMRRGVAEIVGSRIRGVHRVKSRLHPIKITPAAAEFRRRAVGRRIVAVERVGKRVVVVLDSDDRIVFEPRMSGLVLLSDPPDEEHLRLRLLLSDGPAPQLLFWNQRGLGVVQLLSPRQFARKCGPGKLGPDALAVSPELLQQALGSSRRAVKVALLDQRAVAGIGNLYASEILHVAGVHPGRACHRISAARWASIHAAMEKVLREAIYYEGSTLADGTYRAKRNREGGYQNHHRVYGRAGQPCPRCVDRDVRRIVQCGRSTFYCPGCQR